MADDMPRFPLTTAAGRVAADSPMGASVHWDRQQAVLGQVSILHSMSVRQREKAVFSYRQDHLALLNKRRRRRRSRRKKTETAGRNEVPSMNYEETERRPTDGLASFLPIPFHSFHSF